MAKSSGMVKISLILSDAKECPFLDLHDLIWRKSVLDWSIQDRLMRNRGRISPSLGHAVQAVESKKPD